DGTFTDVTEAWGLPRPYPAAATGAVFFDYDNDGWPDLYVSAITGGDRLFHNTGTGRFVDVSAAVRIPAGRWASMPTVADYDRDGWPDLYVANEFGGNALYRNNGDGTFSERAAAAGVVDGGASMGVAWGDYDGDGRLDLFVSNMHANSGWALFHPDFPAPVPRLLQLIGLFTPEVGRRTELIVDHLVRGSSLYHNNGDGTF